MNIEYLTIKNIKNTNMFNISAGTLKSNKKNKLVEFIFKIDKSEVKNLSDFSKDLDNCKSSTLKISDDSYIKYEYNLATVTFCSNNFIIKLRNGIAPECLTEELSDMLTELE